MVNHLNIWEGLNTKMMNARDTATPETTVMATLLVRTDAEIFRLHFGANAAEVAASLSNGHCFQVLPVFALPLPPKSISDRVAAFVVESGGTCLGCGWFSGIAVDMLAAFLVRLCLAGDGALQGSVLNLSPHELPRAGEPDRIPEVSTSCATIAGSRPDSPRCQNVAPDATATKGPECNGGVNEHEGERMAEEEDEGVVDEIWRHVEGSPAAEADKAVDIRVALENRLGKVEAKRLLASTRATVAKQKNGHKNRILCIGRIALKMRNASTC